MNQMYNHFGNRQQDMNGMVERIKQFRNAFRGDPHQQLQEMINSGKIPQNVLNQAQEMAKPIYEAMKALM